MQFVNYFFASIISFLGFLTGILLIKIAPEEQKPLERHFVWLRRSLLFLIFIFAAFYYPNRLSYILISLGFFIFLLFLEIKTDKLLKKSAIAYMILGIIFFLSSRNMNLFVLESSLLFLYGLPTASLLFNKKEKNYLKIILYNMGFIAVGNFLFLLDYHFSFLIPQ